MFKIGDRVILKRDWQSQSNKNSTPFYRDYLNEVFNVIRVESDLVFVDDKGLEAAFHWRFDLHPLSLENK